MLNTTPSLHLSHSGHCATITLHRRAHHNRLHREDLVALMAHFRAIEADPAIRVLVFNADVLADKPVFCAGYHIGEHGQEDPDATFEAVADTLENLRPVTVCALGGSVYGGATDLVLACDFSIGVQGMLARMPAAALGLHYYPGGVARFVTRLGLPNAKRAFLGAETFGDAELLRIGFVQQLVPVAEHVKAVDAQVTTLLGLAPLALQSLKASLNEVARGEFNAQRLRERMVMTQASSDFKGACRAFVEKRRPTFSGH
jgi:enoyl-CoA hydratase/carnithine racemase